MCKPLNAVKTQQIRWSVRNLGVHGFKAKTSYFLQTSLNNPGEYISSKQGDYAINIIVHLTKLMTFHRKLAAEMF